MDPWSTGPSNIGPMTPKPVVIIPPRSPRLEATALAVLWGAADESGTAPLPLIVADPSSSLPSAVDAPRVFLGWRADLEESRQLAARTLAALADPTSSPRQIATFEVSLRESITDPTESPPEGWRATPPQGPTLAPPERFVLGQESDGDPAGLLELARARRWAARTYAQWHATPETASSEPPRPDASPNSSRSIEWCGIAD